MYNTNSARVQYYRSRRENQYDNYDEFEGFAKAIESSQNEKTKVEKRRVNSDKEVSENSSLTLTDRL